MLPPYDRPYLSFAEQVDLLKQRGMTVSDDARAARHLERIGYYRLKSYWFPFRETRTVTAPSGKPVDEVLEDFRPGSDFRHAVDLYVFDKRLRLLLTDAIERIEVAIRVDVAHTIGRRDAWAHQNARFLDPKRAVHREPDGRTRHEAWLERASDAENRSKADWHGQFRRQYSSALPIWIAVELWDFGVLSRLLEIAHPVDRYTIAQKYGIQSSELLVSWVKTLAYVRNVCAHHGRLWNHPLVAQPMLPKGSDVPRLAHLRNHNSTQTRVYAAAAIAQHFLDVINPTSSWKVRLRALWASFPTIPGVSPAQAGFLQNWGAAALWQ
jgi:abortive infection bacteriophage resistance protein